jgi:hypothetical protein
MNRDAFPPRAWSSLLIGAVVGGVGTIVGIWLVTIIDPSVPGETFEIAYAVPALVYATLIWLVGLLVLGLAPWLVLHRFGFRGWISAVMLGIALTFLLPIALTAGSEGLNWPGTFIVCAGFGCLGVVVAISIWLNAYRPWRKSPIEVS